MAVFVIAALFWVFSLAPTALVGPGTAVEVPDVSGMEAAEGMQELEDLGLLPRQTEDSSDTIESGYIIGTDIDPGSTVSPGQEIVVIVSAGKAKVTLPNLSFKSEAEPVDARWDRNR